MTVLPDGAKFTHLTAARLYGLWLPPIPVDLPVFVSLPRGANRVRRPEIQAFRVDPVGHRDRSAGVPVVGPEELLLSCARDLGVLDLVVLGDCLLHRGWTDLDRLTAAAARHRAGAPVLRSALAWMSRSAESPWESLLRVQHRAAGLQVVPQHVVRDAQDRFVARGDLWLPGTRMLHEYDGAGHRDRATHVRDLDRDRRLLAAGWARRAYTAREVMRCPGEIIQAAMRLLGCPFDPSMLQPWRQLLGESLFSGQPRLARYIRG
ncbi:MAG: hypothetical protein HZY75_06815 [Nocardioidaceae bacterium]|nr:MAG: hypothetical protein HZY75_06815 [Nocardioidaceae bacterium]